MVNILIFSLRTMHNAPRVIREIDALNENYHIHTIGQTQASFTHLPYCNIYELRTFFDKILNAINYRLFKLKLKSHFVPSFRKIHRYVAANNIGLLIIHEPEFLHLAVSLKRKLDIKIVFNAHEFHPLEFEDQKEWLKTQGKYYDKLYSCYLSELDLLINVSDGIAEKCLRKYKVRSIVIPNVALYSDIGISENANESKIKLVYHGAILPGREIDEMINMMKILGEGYVLYIIGASTDYNREYFTKLQKLATNFTNVRFEKPVSFQEIIPTINKYDIGIYILKPNGFNNKYALPNKLFEYLQAKLAIAISPSIEMKKIVEKYNIGVVAEDFTAEGLAKKIKRLTKQDIINYKNNAVKVSKLENAEKYKAFYLSEIQTLLN